MDEEKFKYLLKQVKSETFAKSKNDAILHSTGAFNVEQLGKLLDEFSSNTDTKYMLKELHKNKRILPMMSEDAMKLFAICKPKDVLPVLAQYIVDREDKAAKERVLEHFEGANRGWARQQLVDAGPYQGPPAVLKTSASKQKTVAEQPSQQRVQQQMQQPVQKSFQQPGQQQFQQPIQQPVQQRFQQPVQQPVQQRFQQPVQQPVQQRFHQPVQQRFQQPVQQPVQQPASRFPVQNAGFPFQHTGFPFQTAGLSAQSATVSGRSSNMNFSISQSQVSGGMPMCAPAMYPVAMYPVAMYPAAYPMVQAPVQCFPQARKPTPTTSPTTAPTTISATAPATAQATAQATAPTRSPEQPSAPALPSRRAPPRPPRARPQEPPNYYEEVLPAGTPIEPPPPYSP